MNPVAEKELADTVARMEARLSSHTDARVAALYELYRGLVPRFEADLAADTRDIALAKASALMLVQAAAQRGR